jgi:hypothetical protein
MYKQMEAAQRCEQLQFLAFQLDVLEHVLDAEGPFVAGAGGPRACLLPSLPRSFWWCCDWRAALGADVVRAPGADHRVIVHSLLCRSLRKVRPVHAAGAEISFGDASLFPSFVFYTGTSVFHL